MALRKDPFADLPLLSLLKGRLSKERNAVDPGPGINSRALSSRSFVVKSERGACPDSPFERARNRMHRQIEIGCCASVNHRNTARAVMYYESSR